MSFVADLAVGKKNEHNVLSIVQGLFPDGNWEINPEKKGVDIVSKTNPFTIECKYDRLAITSGNIFIEISCSGTPSGIYKYDNLSVLSYSFGNTTMLINAGKLKKYIEANASKLRKLRGGDGWRVEGYLVAIEEIKKITSRIIYDNQN